MVVHSGLAPDVIRLSVHGSDTAWHAGSLDLQRKCFIIPSCLRCKLLSNQELQVSLLLGQRTFIDNAGGCEPNPEYLTAPENPQLNRCSTSLLLQDYSA